MSSGGALAERGLLGALRGRVERRVYPSGFVELVGAQRWRCRGRFGRAVRFLLELAQGGRAQMALDHFQTGPRSSLISC